MFGGRRLATGHMGWRRHRPSLVPSKARRVGIDGRGCSVGTTLSGWIAVFAGDANIRIAVIDGVRHRRQTAPRKGNLQKVEPGPEPVPR